MYGVTCNNSPIVTHRSVDCTSISVYCCGCIEFVNSGQPTALLNNNDTCIVHVVPWNNVGGSCGPCVHKALFSGNYDGLI